MFPMQNMKATLVMEFAAKSALSFYTSRVLIHSLSVTTFEVQDVIDLGVGRLADYFFFFVYVILESLLLPLLLLLLLLFLDIIYMFKKILKRTKKYIVKSKSFSSPLSPGVGVSCQVQWSCHQSCEPSQGHARRTKRIWICIAPLAPFIEVFVYLVPYTNGCLSCVMFRSLLLFTSYVWGRVSYQ